MKILMSLITMLITFSANALSKGEIIYPLGHKEVTRFIEFAKTLPTKTMGLDAKELRVHEKNNEGSSMFSNATTNFFVYDLDINNDGTNEYVVIDVMGGRLATSGIYKVISHDKNKVISPEYDFQRIVSKNLWKSDSRDFSKFHLWLAAPAIVKRDSHYILRYLDRNPKAKFSEYLWKGQSFNKIRESSENNF